MDGTVSAVAVSAHDKFYAAASMSGQVKIFSVEHGTVVDEFKIQGTHANALAFLETSYGQAILVGTNHGQVVARHVERKEELATVTFDEKGSSMRVEDEHGGPKQYSEVHALAVSRPFDKEGHADGDAIMAVGGKLVQPPDFVEVFTVAQQPFMGVLETANKSPVRSSGMRGSGITDAPLQPMVITLRARLRTIGTLTRTVSLDRDGTILVAGGDARVVQMWSLRRARSKGVWSAVKPEVEFRCVSTIQSLAIAPKGDILAVGLSAHTEVYSINRATLSSALFELGMWEESGGNMSRETTQYFAASPIHEADAAKIRKQKMQRQASLRSVQAAPPLSRSSSNLTGNALSTALSLEPSGIEKSVTSSSGFGDSFKGETDSKGPPSPPTSPPDQGRGRQRRPSHDSNSSGSSRRASEMTRLRRAPPRLPSQPLALHLCCRCQVAVAPRSRGCSASAAAAARAPAVLSTFETRRACASSSPTTRRVTSATL